MKTKKIVNDPVYGFISIRSKLILRIINHPYFQRLRRINQLGLTYIVYPGAHHTRFHHALGAMHLMENTLDSLKSKGHKISKQEYEAALIAILLHDIGHGPFSHALEYSILKNVDHEEISLLLMHRLNEEFGGKLGLAIKIFSDKYERRFFHQLVSSQLDIDRLDYLQRDCYFTGVTEGHISFDRIIRMLDIIDDQIVVEEKGIYSIENFLNARRLMYWQVYLHKTTVSAEQMITQIIKRAKDLTSIAQDLYASPTFMTFLKHETALVDFTRPDSPFLSAYAMLDDYDIMSSVKAWAHHPDKVLGTLSKKFLNRELFKTQLGNKHFQAFELIKAKENVKEQFGLTDDESDYFVTHGSISNSGYVSDAQNILIKMKSGETMDVAKASDLPNIEALCQIVTKHYLCHPK